MHGHLDRFEYHSNTGVTCYIRILWIQKTKLEFANCIGLNTFTEVDSVDWDQTQNRQHSGPRTALKEPYYLRTDLLKLVELVEHYFAKKLESNGIQQHLSHIEQYYGKDHLQSFIVRWRWACSSTSTVGHGHGWSLGYSSPWAGCC